MSRREVLCHTGAVAAVTVTVTVPVRRIACAFGLAVLALLVSATPDLTGPSPSASAAAPLRAPKTTAAQDTKFFTDVAGADAALASYEQKQGNVALRALLTDGSAFCALLMHEKDLDAALVDEATGAESSESQTHLPLSVTTFNTIESVSLLTLCPSELGLLPSSDRTKIRNLGKSLATRTRTRR
jgi:hypothetical protein